jgi:GNAT superfamily N-acetyltransferase
MTIRRATREEAGVVCVHRRAMFADMGHRDGTALDAMTAHFLPWVESRLASGEYLGWFAVAADGTVVAGLGIWLMDWPPHMAGPGKPRANILNVYTQPEFRRRGLARSLMQTALDWCREQGIRTVILHASQEGRELYESFGFGATNEMRLML